jgi:hypothetical protein
MMLGPSQPTTSELFTMILIPILQGFTIKTVSLEENRGWVPAFSQIPSSKRSKSTHQSIK